MYLSVLALLRVLTLFLLPLYAEIEEMSSEGAMSVVGSEVMPLDYGSMDSESSPSPTSSERTMEERREEIVVEEEEDEIPSNILEAGGGSSLRGLVENCNLPHHVLIRPTEVNERASSAPQDHWMPLGGGRGEKGWYYFGPRPSSKENKSLFSAGPSSIKGWKEKFFFVDDTEWSRGDAEVEQLSAWKAKKTKQNNYKLNENEVEEVEKLVREEGDVVDILYLTSPQAIEAAELYGPSSLSEAEMDEFINAAGGLHIPKKPRKKSKTSTGADKGAAEKERLPSTSARVLKIQQRPKPARGGSEEVSEKVVPLQRKKRKVAEPEVRGDEVTEFVPRPFAPEINPEVRERKRVKVRGPSRGKELIPPHLHEKSLFEAANTTGAKHFLNCTLLEVDRRQARDEAVSRLGATVVRHALEEYAESVRDRANLQRQCEQLQKEKEELQKEKEEWEKEKEEWEKEKREMQRRLDEVLPLVTELQNENDVLSTKLVLEERKRKICEEKLEAQDKYIDKMRKGAAELKKNVNLLVHNGMEEHIDNFLNSSTFEGILKLYRLPTAILAFTDCRKKVNAQYPEVDVTMVTFGEREEGVEEDEGRTVFPPTFNAELVAVEGEEEEEEEEEEQGAGEENQANQSEAQPPVVHPVSSDEVQQLAPPEEEVPPPPAKDEPRSPPLPPEEQPPPPVI
ncbi:hypothetical protein SLEP1_g23602 [Rubroshorea leprosula]|uniref:Uncharacterized protein n=1 Tax=Rubroshorea leprosula TaxID=152421 RepID=A0AAV5JFY7_9ROSI|nr:hypothetical protein SLEP1_g23602 [Rubroshorea leprosula]